MSVELALSILDSSLNYAYKHAGIKTKQAPTRTAKKGNDANI